MTRTSTSSAVSAGHWATWTPRALLKMSLLHHVILDCTSLVDHKLEVARKADGSVSLSEVNVEVFNNFTSGS